MAKRLFLRFIVILLLAIGLLPVLSMLIKSMIVNGRFSLAFYEGLLTSAHQWTLMGHSLALSSLVTALTVAVGLPLGVLLGKTDLPWRRFFTVLFVIPLLIPPYIVAVSWFDLLGREITAGGGRLLQAGFHEIPLDASRWSSGVYLWSLEAGKNRGSGTAVVLR